MWKQRKLSIHLIRSQVNPIDTKSQIIPEMLPDLCVGRIEIIVGDLSIIDNKGNKLQQFLS